LDDARVCRAVAARDAATDLVLVLRRRLVRLWPNDCLQAEATACVTGSAGDAAESPAYGSGSDVLQLLDSGTLSRVVRRIGELRSRRHASYEMDGPLELADGSLEPGEVLSGVASELRVELRPLDGNCGP
jgi:hypothetical protein